MNANGDRSHGHDEKDTRLAVPLWGIGAAVFAWGLVRGRPLVMALGAAAFLADHEAEPVVRVRELVGELRAAR